jgi:hypothetical protein
MILVPGVVPGTCSTILQSGREVCHSGSSKHGPQCQLLWSIWVRGSISGNISNNSNDDAGDDNLVGAFIVIKERNDTDIVTTATDNMGDY